MSKIRYEERRFNAVSLTVVEQAGLILDEYDAQGYRMSLRALYYQFIRRDLFPDSRAFVLPGNTEPTKNVQKNYKWLGDLLTDARVGGYIDWDHLEDPTRERQGGDYGYRDPAHRVELVPDGYTIPKWPGQGHYLEIWVEKAALLDIVSRPAGRWNVASLACKGSPSTSAMHEAAQRLRQYERTGLKTTILYLGDHDPTGIDISRDVQDRLELFRARTFVDRIALNWDQITDDLPPSPAKATDSRTNGYIDQFGTEDTWELDAMEPSVMDALVEAAILERLDRGLWDDRVAQQERDRVELRALADNWPGVRDWMDGESMITYPAPEDDEEN